ncbi:MAG TPA: phospholipase D-like domain-containing protein [Vicinamibacterales bacterium]|nr:phospholipase D-like domain-containing protein [Vicinamibacterales bacterium]
MSSSSSVLQRTDDSAPVSLHLTCDFPGAEVLLVDGQLRLVDRALQEIRKDVPPGIYTARVRIGEASRDERLIVRPGKPFERTLLPPAVASAIPLDGSATSHEYHQDAARLSTSPDTPALDPAADSALFVLLREWTPEGHGRRDRGPLAPELILCSADGAELHTFDTTPTNGATADRAAGRGVRVRAGFYRLMSRAGDEVIELPLFAVAGWQTQVFVMSQPTAGVLAPDFSHASIVWVRLGARFDPDREDFRILESARTAAQSGRHHITDKGLRDALYMKFENPMLGLLSAHALLQRKAIEPDLLSLVTRNLQGMLGPLPDIAALTLAHDPDADVPPIEQPPMLRWSWELLLQQSVDRPGLIHPQSLAEQVGGHVVGQGVWMSWVSDSRSERIGSRTRTAVVADPVAKAARRAWRHECESTARRPSSAVATAASALESVGAVQNDASQRASMKRIVRWYGVPRSVIDEGAGQAAAWSVSDVQRLKGVQVMDQQKRANFNERFYRRLLARRPQDRTQYEQLLAQPEAAFADFPGTRERAFDVSGRPEAAFDLTGAPGAAFDPRDIALETIVSRERPVLFVKDGAFDTTDATILGPEAEDLIERMKRQGSRLLPMLPLIGRIDVVNFPGNDFLGTGWFVDTDVVVTNRHVASLIAKWDGRRFAFARGIAGRVLQSSVCNAHEFDDLAPDASRVFTVKEVLYIEKDSSPNDIAFLKVDRRTDGRGPSFISVASSDVAAEVPVCVIGYPARAPKSVIPDQALMNDLYRGRFDVKRAAPGFSSGIERGASTHDCTTLGGNSGSVVLELETGTAVGLHFAGLYKQDNFAVRASILSDYIRRKRWNMPPEIETRPSAAPPSAVPVAPVASTVSASTVAPASSVGGGSVSLTVPLTITVSLGVPPAAVAHAGAPPGAPSRVDVPRVEDAVASFWDARPEGVLAVRVGYFDTDDGIGDVPCIAASVEPARWAAFEATGPQAFQGVPVRYLPADVDEQIQARPGLESVDSIAYDDDARTGQRFSFAEVDERMQITLHVGPEYSWEVLEKFLGDAQGRLVSAMYEFHGSHIKDALEARLRDGASLTLVVDNASFSKVKDPDEEFDRVDVFEEWADKFTFTRVVAPEGLSGLISDSYHIKVTVRDDDTFWLSSGNWKMKSSQPIITEEERENATEVDLPGNREWHVVIKNKTLATRFRSHILQDFARSTDLGGGPVSPSLMEETLVDIPLEETMVLERRPPRRILEPLKIDRVVKVKPLLTPDREGAVFSEAVLRLIESARTSLLFQIPYIGMPPNPRVDRGFIDELIKALTRKLKTLDDARVILRSGGSKFSAPAHAGWFFKSKGVDIDNRLRVIENHHTKGMIVDGKRVLIGSHNWSKPGVSLNRDASLLFDDAEVASYYTDAFEIDWARANKVTPKKFIKTEAVVLEATGATPPPGFQRVRLSDLLKDD